ncbi:MAG: recombinase family protein [Novosphingobium sp.]
MKRVRCAIYTRKSSEEGLEQDFNSLHAQREACAAYVLSQASEGWVLSPEVYDDGGISGGTLERPALKRLLADIAEGKIDIVVVYKVDRLTRSLLDFSKLVEAFDSAEVSFVSITQSFNTTTSMGRLTLNMLLSFAQFEREVTAERIRDKIAASKAKGMWMGGIPPIGYEPHERTLRIDAEQAVFVRHVFARYLELGTVQDLAEDLDRRGVRSPVRAYPSGRRTGGGKFTRGQLYYLLNNPIYIGRIRHRDKTYAGQHPAIIDAATWEAVQVRLADNTQGTQRRRGSRPSLLAGLLRDEQGRLLLASHASKPGPGGAEAAKVRYRYYISQPIQNRPAANAATIRIPAKELEAAVTSCVAEAIADPLGLAVRLAVPLDGLMLAALTTTAAALAARIRAKERDIVRAVVAQVDVRHGEIGIALHAAVLARELGLPAPAEARITITSAVRLTRTGRAMRLIQADGRAAGQPEPRSNLIKLILKARGWWARLAQGDIDIATLAREEGMTASYVTRVTRLAFLSPTVVEAILDGRHPASLDGGKLLAPGLPANWQEQKQVFLSA